MESFFQISNLLALQTNGKLFPNFELIFDFLADAKVEKYS